MSRDILSLPPRKMIIYFRRYDISFGLFLEFICFIILQLQVFLLDPTSVGEENETPVIRVWKPLPSKHVLLVVGLGLGCYPYM